MVVTILAILAMMIVPSMQNLYLHSRQTARNNIARSVFMAAQSALTNRYAQGDAFKNAYIGATSNTVDVSSIPDIPEPERTVNFANLRYLSTAQGAYDDNNALVQLLDPYMGDKEVLHNAILIEFNVLTGRVLSAFYSDDIAAQSVGYGAGSMYNVQVRTEAALEAGCVGYYGVDSTGEVIQPAPINAVKVVLVDDVDPNSETYGLLMAKCTLPQGYTDKFSFELTLEPQAGTPSRVAFTNDPTNTTAIQLSDIKMHLTLSIAMQNPYAIGARNIRILYEELLGEQVLTFFLDGADEALAIETNYPGVSCGFLSASFSATDGADTVTAFSNLKHAYYGGKVLGATENIYTVESVRHLNNVRLTPAGKFRQARAVEIKNYAGGADILFDPLCTAAAPFTGEYNGGNYRILGLHCAGGANAGLFGYIGVGGVVSYLCLDRGTTALSGTKYAGGIACVNAGTVNRCSVFSTAGVSTTAVGGVAGAIVAVNEAGGTVSYCYSGTNVTGNRAAGGIAGVNNGRITCCEVGTAAKGGALAAGCFPFCGSNLGGSANYHSPTLYAVANNSWSVEVLDPGGAAGGIAGSIESAGGKVQRCVNADEVKGGNTAKYTGGVVGKVDFSGATALNSVENSINAGSVFGAGTAGGVVGYLGGNIAGCYNTGTVNTHIAEYTDIYGADLSNEGRPRFYYVSGTENLSATGPNEFGGIVGCGAIGSSASYCYSIMYAGDRYGGAFGVMGGSIDRCYYRRSVYNATNTYYNGVSTVSTDTLRLTGRTLRTIFSGVTFHDGNAANGVGAFKYPFPYLIDADVLNDAFHRTPWRNVLESKGEIGLTNDANDVIHIRLLALPMETDFYIGNSVGYDLNNCIHFHIDQSDAWGTQTASRLITETGGAHRTFTAYRSDATEEEKLLGYKYAYHILTNWSDFATGTSTVRAQLYGGGSTSQSDLFDEETLRRPYGLSFQTVNDPTHGAYTYLEVSITDFGTQPTGTVRVLYTGSHAGSTATVDLDADNFATPATSYETAYAIFLAGGPDANKVSAPFSGGQGSHTGTALVWRDGAKYCVFLYGAEFGTNSLRKNSTFCASITFNGVTYDSTNDAIVGN